MIRQKFILHSKTIWAALLNYALAFTLIALQNENLQLSTVSIIGIALLTVTTYLTIISRYYAWGLLYTPRGIIGRSYVPAWQERENKKR